VSASDGVVRRRIAAKPLPRSDHERAVERRGDERTVQRRDDLAEPEKEKRDEDLLASARQGDEAAFGVFVRRHAETVHRWMARAVGQEDADDATQEIFLKAYRGLSAFRGEAPPRAWLASIADNAVKNRYRSRSRFRRVFAGSWENDQGFEPPAAGNGPEDDARAGESRRLVTEALSRLEPEFRMPVVLRDIEEWSYDEIAVSLGLPIGTVKSRIARGRGHLREILAPLLSGRWP
jgi:RNA polymerase sigma-70 factor (ECF subfamily)